MMKTKAEELEKFVNLYNLVVAQADLGKRVSSRTAREIANWMIGYNPDSIDPIDSEVVYGYPDYTIYYLCATEAEHIKNRDVSMRRFANMMVELDKTIQEKTIPLSGRIRKSIRIDPKITDLNKSEFDAALTKDEIMFNVRSVDLNDGDVKVIHIPDGIDVEVKGVMETRILHDNANPVIDIEIGYGADENRTNLEIVIDLGLLISEFILRSDSRMEFTVVPRPAYLEVQIWDRTTNLIHIIKRPYIIEPRRVIIATPYQAEKYGPGKKD